MAGQLAALLCAGLLASHLATVLVLRAYSDALNPGSRDHVLEHMASAYHIAQSAPEAELARLLQAMSSQETQFRITAEAPPPTPESDRLPELYNRLSAKLPEAQHLRVRVERGSATEDVGSMLDLPVVWVHAAARLPDGRWLHSMQQSRANRSWWWWLGLWLPVSTLPVLVLAIVFLYRTLRPIKALAQAAEQVSRGEQVEPLPVIGPGEVREVSAAFNTMQSRLIRFIDDRTRLLAAVSHDVRTPIASLRVRAELVEDPALRAAMARTLDDMGAMVEQTLHFARDDAAGEPMREVDLRALLDDVAHDVRVVSQDVEIDVEPGLPRYYRARPSSLRRALGNLLDNAGRHGDGRVWVRLLEAPLRIEIDDAGRGLAPELIERVFEPFFQADTARNHRRQGVGVGLGLAIARSCVRAHGGEVTLANRPGGGLRATLCLP
jgi:signal transduction histidine kinase